MHDHDLYYVRPENVVAGVLTLEDDEFHHLIHVKRKTEGHLFLAVDGKGRAYECRIDRVEQNILKASILRMRELLGEPRFQLTLAIAIPKNNRLEWIIEKGTEIGITKFKPLITKRTVVRSKPSRVERYTRISLAAMKQSQRSVLPVIEEPEQFDTMCKGAIDYDVKLIAHEREPERNLEQVLKQFWNGGTQHLSSALLCIGAEGGFTDDEITLAKKSGFATFGMGPRRLRSETAALVGSTMILSKMDELG